MYQRFDVHNVNGPSRSPFGSTDNLCASSLDMHGNLPHDKYSHSSTSYEHENQCSNDSTFRANAAATMSGEIVLDANSVGTQQKNSMEWLVKVPTLSSTGSTYTREYNAKHSSFSATPRSFTGPTMNQTSSVPMLQHGCSEHNNSTNTLDGLGYGNTPTASASYFNGPPRMMANHNMSLPYTVTSCTTSDTNNLPSSMLAHHPLLANSHMSEIHATMQHIMSTSASNSSASVTGLTSALVDLADVSTDEQLDLQFIQGTSYRIRMLPPPLPLHVHKEIWCKNEYGEDFAVADPNSPGAQRTSDSQASLATDAQVATTPSATVSMWQSSAGNGIVTNNKANGVGREKQSNSSAALPSDMSKISRENEVEPLAQIAKSSSELDITAGSAQMVEKTLDKEERLVAYRQMMLRWYRHVRVLESKPEVRQRITRTHVMCPTLHETRQRFVTETSAASSSSADDKNALEEQVLSVWSEDCLTWWRGTFRPRARNARATESRTDELDVLSRTEITQNNSTYTNNTNTNNYSMSSDSAMTPSYVEGAAYICKPDNSAISFQSRLPHVGSSTNSLFNLTNEIVDDEDQIAWTFTHDLLKTIDDE